MSKQNKQTNKKPIDINNGMVTYLREGGWRDKIGQIYGDRKRFDFGW